MLCINSKTSLVENDQNLKTFFDDVEHLVVRTLQQSYDISCNLMLKFLF